jgi:ribosomal-protein-alanine N-acetyltransferase
VEHRRRGIAGLLLAAVRDLAAAQGAPALLLEVRETNAGALAFYERAGFAEIDRRPRYYRNGDTAIVMSLALQGR